MCIDCIAAISIRETIIMALLCHSQGRFLSFPSFIMCNASVCWSSSNNAIGENVLQCVCVSLGKCIERNFRWQHPPYRVPLLANVVNDEKNDEGNGNSIREQCFTFSDCIKWNRHTHTRLCYASFDDVKCFHLICEVWMAGHDLINSSSHRYIPRSQTTTTANASVQ